jgi:hypothetical protein
MSPTAERRCRIRIESLLAQAAPSLLLVLISGCAEPPRLQGELELETNPSGHAPLAALLHFTTDKPARVTLSIDNGQTVAEVTPSDAYANEHHVPILGVAPGRANAIAVRLTDEGGRVSEAGSVTFEAPPLPEALPPIEVLTSRPARMEPGVTLLPFFRWKTNEPDPDRDYGLIVALDAAGEVIWYYETDHTVDEPRPLRNGNLLYQSELNGNLYEIDMLGRVVRHWYTTGIPKKDVPAGSIPVAGESIHHDSTEMPSGNLLVLTTEVRRMEWPASPKPDAEVRERNVIGDVLIEVSPADGKVVRSWKLFDIFDTQRRGFGSFFTGFYDDVYEEVLDEPGYDWLHTNSLFYLPKEDAVLLSSPSMCALSKLDLGTGKLRWILGLPDGWREPWSDLLLEPVGEIAWFCGQHAAEVTARGTILLYDNDRPGFPGRPQVPDDENYSRALELEVDEEKGTVRQVWSYGGPGPDRILSPFISEADSLPVTGNVLLTNGGQMNDANGKATANFAAGHHWVSLVEVTHETPAEKVWEVVIDDPRGGWASYRSERVGSLYPSLR